MANAFVDAFDQRQTDANLSSQIDGITRTFVVPQSFESSSIVIYYNGVRQLRTDVTVLSSRTFQMSFIPQVSTAIVVVFQPI